MTDIDDLWPRIDEARRRLGVADQAQFKQLEHLSARLKEMRGGLAQRLAEMDRLRGENEHLRGMLYRLLLAIEARYGGGMRDILQDLEGQVHALVELAQDKPPVAPPSAKALAGPANGHASGVAKAKRLRLRKIAPDLAAEIGEAPAQGAERPDEGDTRWLKEIMERARELTVDFEGPRADGESAVPQGNEVT
ncbi:MAG: hypothetical protein ACE5DS_01610 [Kiloniellaceae bacterium]